MDRTPPPPDARVAGVEPAALGLRERKKLRTQKDLQAAALRLFAEHGFDHVSTDDIAAAAEVSKTTFYRYFDSKEDVLLGDKAEALCHMRDALAGRPDTEPPFEALRGAVKEVVGHFALDREASGLRQRLMRETPSAMARNLERQREWETLVADFVRPRLAPGANRDLLARVYAANTMATMRATIEHWLDSDGADVSELLDEALAAFAVSDDRRPAPAPA
ncbi:MAG: HTH-type transcriptional regulator betI [Acidimicrobiales bacterium]|nr:HTH-type transcriptional regulator betI [Acidimicrobiales bacterium]